MKEFHSSSEVSDAFRIGDPVEVKWFDVWLPGYYGGRSAELGEEGLHRIDWLAPKEERYASFDPGLTAFRKPERSNANTSPAGFVAGQAVAALYSDDLWYPAEIRKTVDNGYLVDWLDGGRGSRVPKEGLIPLPTLSKHRFALGDRIIVEVDKTWYSGVVAGLIDVGYWVTWENGEDRTRILDAEAFPFPGRLPVAIGARCVVLDDANWYPAVIKSVYSDGYDVLLGERRGSGARGQ
jgi:hypothetical protein